MSNFSEEEELYHDLVRLGESWAEANAAGSLLEETKKTVRAQLAIKYLKDAKSIGKAELMAEADPLYLEHIIKMVDARKGSNITKVNYDGKKTYIDLVRTKEATRRAEQQYGSIIT